MLRCRATALVFDLAACGDGITDPTEVPYGETSFVVIANPVVNDANQTAIASPGTAQSGVSVSVQGGVSAATDTFGVAVLSPVTAGAWILTFSGDGTSGDVELEADRRGQRRVGGEQPDRLPPGRHLQRRPGLLRQQRHAVW
jgi:hypothetical protein